MIVVGNPTVLATDKHWAALLRLAAQNGAYTGAPLPDGFATRSGGSGGGGGDDLDKMTALLQRLVLSSGQDDDGGGAAGEEELQFGGDEAGVQVEGVPMRRVD